VVGTTGLGSQGVNANGNNVTLTVGNFSTTATGISITANGNADLTCSNGATSEDNAPAVSVVALGSADVTCGNLQTSGDNSAGLAITTGTGPLTGSVGAVSTTGDNSLGVALSSPGAITFTTGNVTTTGDTANGVDVLGGAGAVALTTGVVNVSGPNSNAVHVLTTTGNQTITVAGASASGAGMDAIVANSTSGNVIVNANGNVTSATGFGINVGTGGTSTVNVNSGTTTGLTGINSVATGGSTINIAGTVSSNAGGFAVNADGGAATLTVASGGVLNGPINLTDNADVVNINGTWNASGTSDFGAGIDTLNNNSNTINTVNGTVFDNLEIFNNNANGLLNLGTGTTTFPDTTTFNNAGTIRAVGGATTLTSLATVASTGLIDLVDGAANDTLTITNAYSGSGSAALAVDYSGAAADVLVIGGATTGSTSITVVPTADIVINPNNVLVVDTNDLTSHFTLGTTNFGLIDLNLTQVGTDYFLNSVPDIAAIEPVVIADMSTNLWYQSADIYSNYAALRRTDLGVERTSNLGVWGQVYYGQDKDDDQDVTAFGVPFTVGRVETKRYGVQAGVDYLMAPSAVVGVTGGYERAKADLHHSPSDFKATGWNAGVYGIFGGGAGFYGDVLAKYDQAKLKFSNPLFDTVSGDPEIKSFGVQGQAGYRFVSGSINFDLGAGLAYVRSKIDDFSVGTIGFDFDRVKSLRGNLSARAGFGNGPFAPFVEAKLFHEFENDRDLNLLSGTAFDTVEGDGRGTWGRIEAGIGAQNSSGPILAAWGDIGDVKGFGVKAGWRFGGKPVEAAPPPPPPPPPPAPPPPATQTCPDGSVILATDTCPVPPPPPAPPPPAPERGL
jgi:hypothetical protein